MNKIHSDAKFLYQHAFDLLEDRLNDLKEKPKTAVRLADFDLSDFHAGDCYSQTEMSLLEEKSQELIISHLQLHLSKNPRQDLLTLGKALKGDGLLLASMLGQESFKEFKLSFEALNEVKGMPLPDVRDIGGLLTNLKFALPVVDRDVIQLSYPDFESLYADMHLFGLKNFYPTNKGLQGKKSWQAMEAYYKKHFTNKNGDLILSLELITLTAFRPHKSQPKPLERGSAELSLSDFLKNKA